MSEDFSDKALMKKAVVALLDRKYGIKRIQTMREAIRKFPKKPRAFANDATIPLNYLYAMATSEAATVLRLLDLTEAKHKALWKDIDAKLEIDTRYREMRKENIRAFRERVRQAIVTEGIRRGHTLTKKELAEFLPQERARWARMAETFKSQHPEYVGHERTHQARLYVNNFVATRYERVRSLEGTLGTKARSEIASKVPTKSSLYLLQKKFNK